MGGLNCVDAADELKYWIILGVALPALVNIIIIALFVWTFAMIRSFRTISDEIVSSTHWLSCTTVRVGIGPSAKKALLEYAKTKPELKKLVATTK